MVKFKLCFIKRVNALNIFTWTWLFDFFRVSYLVILINQKNSEAGEMAFSVMIVILFFQLS